jgi:acetamidase/formamidase
MSEPTITESHTAANWADAVADSLEVMQNEIFCVRTRDRFAPLEQGLPIDKASTGRLIGPVHIKGVNAGDIVAIEVLSILPRTGRGYLLASKTYGIFGDSIENRVRGVDVTSAEVELTADVQLPYQPMIGKIGLRTHTLTLPLGRQGGALSTTLLGPGATLLVEAQASGGGLMLEDVHAYMGDGEATASAVEMAAEVRLRCSVLNLDSVFAGIHTSAGAGAGAGAPRAQELPMPMLLTHAGVSLFGSAHSTDDALALVTETMATFIMRQRNVDRTEAALLIGAAVHTQVSYLGMRPVVARATAPRTLLTKWSK